MKLNKIPTKEYQNELTMDDFLVSFNDNMPGSFPKVNEELLLQFKQEYPTLFKNSKKWSLDIHRKKLID